MSRGHASGSDLSTAPAGCRSELLTLSGYYDVALRDFGLLAAAVSLARLSQAVHTGAEGGR